MRKNLGVQPYLYPQPVLLIASYNEDGSTNAMNAAWGCICDMNKIALFLSVEHKTVQNILNKGAFSVSIADAAHVQEADYLGIVSGNNVANKVAKAHLATIASDFVDAPILVTLPLALECKLLSYDKESECMIGEIMNVSADEQILDSNGNIDPVKLQPLAFDSANNAYLVCKEKVGHAFKDGFTLKDA